MHMTAVPARMAMAAPFMPLTGIRIQQATVVTAAPAKVTTGRYRVLPVISKPAERLVEIMSKT